MKELNFEQMAQVEGGGESDCAGAVVTAVVVTILCFFGGPVAGAIGAAAGAGLIADRC